MKSTTAAMDAHLAQTTTTLATCWKITRTDGVIFGFTDHDRALTIGGLTYQASSGFFRSAIASSATTSVDNLEVAGFLDAESITETELRNGAFDYAEVEIFAVNWADLSAGIIRLRYGLFGEVTIAPSGVFTVQLRGLTQLFSQVVGEVYSAECRADLGDHRCRVVVEPPLYEEGATYRVGDRVRIPVDALSTAPRRIQLPVRNPGFDTPRLGSIEGWSLTDARLIDTPLADSGRYAVAPLLQSGDFAQTIAHRNYLPTDQHSRRVNMAASIRARAAAPGWEARVHLTYTNTSNSIQFAGAVSAWTEVPVGTYTTLSVSLVDPGTAFAQATRTRMRVEWRRSFGTGSVAPLLFDSADLTVSGANAFNLLNRNFDNPLAEFFPPDWAGSNLSAEVSAGRINLAPASGTYFLRLFRASSVSQVVDLPASVSVRDLIDGSRMTLEIGAKVALLEWGNEPRFEVTFRTGANGTGNAIGAFVGPYEELFPVGEWQTKTLAVDVPPTARSCQIAIRSRGGPLSNSVDVGVDDVMARLVEKQPTPLTHLAFGGVEYLCTREGRSAGDFGPSLTKVIGETIDDGTAAWQVVAPVHSFLSTITSVESNTTFTIDAPNRPDGWFDYGVVTLLDGPNRLRNLEVKTWTASTRRVVLALPFPWRPEVGQRVRIVTGCDRGRAVCHQKFGNILNFRGEPDIPGTDQYFRVGTPG